MKRSASAPIYIRNDGRDNSGKAKEELAIWPSIHVVCTYAKAP